MIDLTKSYKTRNGYSVRNLIGSGLFLKGEIVIDGKWESISWFLDGRLTRHFLSDGDLVEVEPQYVEHTRETLAEVTYFYFIDNGYAWVTIKELLPNCCVTSNNNNLSYKDLLKLKWANGPNKGKPVGRLQQS